MSSHADTTQGGCSEQPKQLGAGQAETLSLPTLAYHSRVVFRFKLAGERWNWPVEGDDSVKAFRELLMLAQVPYTAAVVEK